MSDAHERTRALIGLGRYQEAAAAARAGLASEPGDPRLALLYATALCEGQDEDAVAAARRAVELQPDQAKAHQVLGWAIYRSGHFARAADQLAHAVSLDPHDPVSHVMRAEALLRMRSGARVRRRIDAALVAEALTHAAEAVRLRPSAAGGYLVHAKACLAEHDPAGARRWAEQALSVQPDNPIAHQILGLAAQQRGDVRSAADHFVDAGKLDPRSDKAITLLRGLRTRLPIGIVVLLVAARGASASRAAAAAVFVIFVLVVIGHRAYGGWNARRQMSERAREALARDRSLGRRRAR
jgi:superkiller protein 3